jgi:hypothetical protein
MAFLREKGSVSLPAAYSANIRPSTRRTKENQKSTAQVLCTCEILRENGESAGDWHNRCRYLSRPVLCMKLRDNSGPAH